MISGLFSILSFIALLGVLIFIHELGHFLTAKKVGIRVDRFSLGFPPNIFKKTWRGTEYCIGLIPLGGFVKMAGESPDEAATGKSDEFSSKTILQRFMVIAAGPIMNYLLAIFLFSLLLFSYGDQTISQTQAIIGDVSPDGPAAQAGLQADDIIISVDGQPVGNFDSLRTFISPHPDQELIVEWTRGTEIMQATMTPALKEVTLESGEIDSVGQIGVLTKILYERNYGFFESIAAGFNSTNAMVVQIFSFVKSYATGQVESNSVGGPIYIAQQSASAARMGLYSFLAFMAMLSVNLAVLNVLPIPVLDGGHMVFLTIEKIKGSPLSMKTRIVAQQVGMVFLLVFILFVSWNDVARMLG